MYGNRLTLKEISSYYFYDDPVMGERRTSLPVDEHKYVVIWRNDGSVELRYDVQDFKDRLNRKGIKVKDCYYDAEGHFHCKYEFGLIFKEEKEDTHPPVILHRKP